MIYEIDLAFCALSSFFFKNFLTFALFLLVGYLIFKYLIQKLSNITVILYLLFMITIFAGGVVLSFIPSKEDIFCPTMIDSYYLGPLTFILLVALLVSIIIDLIRRPFEIKEEKKEIKKVKKVRNSKKKKSKE